MPAPPLALVIAVPPAIARWRVGQEWLAWSTLLVFSVAMSWLDFGIFIRNGWSLH